MAYILFAAEGVPVVRVERTGMRSSLLKICAAALALLAGMAAAAGAQPEQRAGAVHTAQIGLNLEGIGDGGRSMPFVDLAKTLRPWTRLDGGGPAPADADGWPTADAKTVLFDIRPVPAWSPPVDDPDAFQPDWSGTYQLSFHGQAQIGFDESPSRITGQTYDAGTDTTRADLIVPKGVGLLVLRFSHTRRTAASPEGTGITDLRVIRPGYPADTRQVFTNAFLRALRPFHVLRYMDWLDTNHNPGYYGDSGHHALEWKDRRLPTDATQQSTDRKYGVAWEYVALLANTTGKDLWINVPVAATDDYVAQLAHFLHRNVKPGLKIYVEHSNEVWNFGFPQYIYNKLAAIDEVKRGGSALNRDGETSEEIWAHRRHAQRLYQIARIFEKEFGPGSLTNRIRPVYASWIINPDSHFRDVLAWMNATYGPPKGYFYAIAGAAYFNAEKAGATADPQQILDAMRASSDSSRTFHTQLKALADRYGLRYCQYEVGPDTGGGSTVNVANRIRANRLPGMKDVILHDARDNWFPLGGDLYMYFSGPSSAYSRYGCWGLNEDVRQLDTPKWQAIYALTGGVTPN